MKKKITSVLLGASLLCQITSSMVANATYETDTNSQIIETKQHGRLKSVLWGAACVVGLAAIAAPFIIHNIRNSSNKGETASDPRRRYALNDAVRKLYNDPEFKSAILKFSCENAAKLINDPLVAPNVEPELRATLIVTLALHEAFEAANKGDLKAIDLTLAQNERLFKALSDNIGTNDNFEDTIRAYFKFVTDGENEYYIGILPELIQKAKDFNMSYKNPFNFVVSTPTSTYDDATKEVSELSKRWKEKYHTPVRALKWHDNLCPIHSSVLLFFHQEQYNQLICRFPIDIAKKLIESGTLTYAQIANLKAMVRLAITFNVLSQYADKRTAAYIDYGPDEKQHEEDLFEKLKTAFCLNNPERSWEYNGLPQDDYDGMIYGKFFRHVTHELYEVIQKTAEISCVDPHWVDFQDMVKSVPKLLCGEPNVDGRQFVGHPELRINHDQDFTDDSLLGGHYWLELTIDGQKLSIGEDDYFNAEGYTPKRIQIQQAEKAE